MQTKCKVFILCMSKRYMYCKRNAYDKHICINDIYYVSLNVCIYFNVIFFCIPLRFSIHASDMYEHSLFKKVHNYDCVKVYFTYLFIFYSSISIAKLHIF